LSGERYKTRIELLSHFDLVALKDIVVKMHQGINTAGDHVEFKDEGYPIIQARNMTSETIDFTNPKFLSKEDWERYKNQHKPNIGDILFSNIGTIGKSVVVDKNINYLIHWNIFKIVVNVKKVLPNYLKQCLGYLTSINYWEQFQKGGTVKFVNKKILNEIQIPVPPFSIQEEIVAEIEGYQKIIYGAKAVVENYKLKIDIDPEWEMVELGEVIKLSSGKGLIAQNMNSGPYPVYGGNGINGYHNEYFLNEPTIVIGRVGAYCGSVHITKPKSWITDNGLYVTGFMREIELGYLAQLLVQLNLNRYAKVGGQPSISQKTVMELSIPIPSLEIQRQIVAQIEKEQS
jgi:restriction endonuclease S subunit